MDSVESGKDISIYINSPGGSVYAGLGIYDTMQFKMCIRDRYKPFLKTILQTIGQILGIHDSSEPTGAKGTNNPRGYAENKDVYKRQGPKGWAVRPLKWHASWVQNVVRQFGLYLSWAYEICVALTLVREDRVGLTAGLPVVPPGALLGI